MKHIELKQQSRLFSALTLIILIGWLTACGGGSSGSSGSSSSSSSSGGATDTTAPQVSQISPVDGAIDVARDAVVSAQFNEDILNTSVDSGSVLLELNGQPVAGVVSFDGLSNTALITPDAPLSLLGNYIATVTTGVTDLAGNALAAEANWSFSVRDGQWRGALLIETDNAGDARLPQIAIDASGNALAVWVQWDGTRYSIWANRYAAGSGWGSAEEIESNTGHAYEPQIASDAAGNALAVWVQWEGTRYSIWANRYAAGSGWGSAALIETDNAGHAYEPQIASDAAGNALAVWAQWDGTRTSIWANRYVLGSGWGSAELIEADNAGDAALPQIAIDAAGNALAVWEQSDFTRLNIWANRYAAGNGWGSAVLIETDNAGDARLPQIAIDASGNALAVWVQWDGTRYSIWANRYAAGSGWGSAEEIESNTGHAYEPQIASDAAGNALAVWVQWEGTRYSIWANRYAAGSGWGSAALIETDNAGHAYEPQIASDAAGNALAVWAQWDGTRTSIWANRYVLGSGWGSAELIEADNAGDAALPQIAIDAAGNALAVWEQSDFTRLNIWANRYAAGSGWGGAVLIETDNAGGAVLPQIASDASGNALAVWEQWDGTRWNIQANRYAVGSGWDSAVLIETDNAGDTKFPQIASDAAGNALAVWGQWDGTRYNIWANRYAVGSGWGSAVLIETNNAGNAHAPQIASDAAGNALAVWEQWDGTRWNFQANRFD